MLLLPKPFMVLKRCIEIYSLDKLAINFDSNKSTTKWNFLNLSFHWYINHQN
jgi:hypothetical protein